VVIQPGILDLIEARHVILLSGEWDSISKANENMLSFHNIQRLPANQDQHLKEISLPDSGSPETTLTRQFRYRYPHPGNLFAVNHYM
jgi:hypothetical protein